ncbi:MAG: helix-hairpin-helix domain-containing protein [Candidatus Brachytrichaceae bacterium NZ_4S206]|jgi:hypothetical protein
MMSEFVQTPTATGSPGDDDDFKRIPGIGPKVEARLREAGIHTYADLAALAPEKLARLLSGMAGLSSKRIESQGWIERARELAHAGQPAVDDIPAPRPRYASFVIRLALSEDGSVRYTEVEDAERPERRRSWAGWDAPALLQFFIEQAGLRERPSVAPATADSPQAPLVITGLDAHESLPGRMRAQVAFELRGETALDLAATAAHYTIQILAHEQAGDRMITLATASGQLDFNTLAYQVEVSFPTPPLGRYRLLGLVVIAEAPAAHVQEGPLIRVAP